MLRRLASATPALPAGPEPARAFRVADRSRSTVVVGAVVALACLGLGVVIGLALTAGAVRRGFGVGAIQIGAWSIAPASGTPDINPYQRARFAATGEIPMAAGQGVALTALRDDGGRKLDRACSYRLTGSVPKARFWTLTALDVAGLPMKTVAQRSSFTTTELVRDSTGEFTITLSPEVSPGNWLPLSGTGRFSLLLRLYDTSVTALTAREIRSLPVPAITRGSCR